MKTHSSFLILLNGQNSNRLHHVKQLILGLCHLLQNNVNNIEILFHYNSLVLLFNRPDRHFLTVTSLCSPQCLFREYSIFKCFTINIQMHKHRLQCNVTDDSIITHQLFGLIQFIHVFFIVHLYIWNNSLQQLTGEMLSHTF